MKKVFLFGALTAGILASCSNDDQPETGNVNNGKAGYLAVNLVAPSSSATRATDGGFEDGSDTEGAADNGLFLLFDADGNQVGNPQSVSLTPWNGAGTPNVENISSSVLVVNNETGKKTATQVLAILNAPSTLSLNGKNLTTVLGEIGSFGQTGKGNFIMTNSVYNVGNTTVCSTPISGHVASTETDAKNNPVDIYVERVVSKVKTNVLSKENVESSEIVIDGKKVTVTPEIKGIEVANIAQTSYLFKNIDGINWTWNWNDETNKRSYWANTPDEPGYSNQSWSDINNTSAAEAHAFYVQENTNQGKPSSVLVTAQLKDTSGNPITIAKFASQYTTVEGAKALLLNALKNAGFRTFTEGASSHGTIDDLTFTVANSTNTWEVKGLVADGKYVKIEGDVTKEISQDDVNKFLDHKAYRVKIWKDGMTYYYVDINHFGTDENGDALKGIVRNHIYDLKLNSLKGIGIPVFNPEQPIIPSKPGDDEYFYLAARINILKWKVVSQDVDFNN